MSSVPGLDQLHDVVIPSRISWWPLAMGWYAMGFVVCLIIFVVLTRLTRMWRRNAYRRMALQEWRHISSTMSGHEQIRALAELLKRTALAAFPRQQVADLCGDDWLRFLDRTSGLSRFENGSGRAFVTGVYDPRIDELSPDAIRTVRDWIVRHRSSATTK